MAPQHLDGDAFGGISFITSSKRSDARAVFDGEIVPHHRKGPFRLHPRNLFTRWRWLDLAWLTCMQFTLDR